MNPHGDKTEKAGEQFSKGDGGATPRSRSISPILQKLKPSNRPGKHQETGASEGGGVKLHPDLVVNEAAKEFSQLGLCPPSLMEHNLRPSSPNHAPVSPAKTPPPPCTAPPPGVMGNPSLPRRPRKNTLSGRAAAVPPDLGIAGQAGPSSSKSYGAKGGEFEPIAEALGGADGNDEEEDEMTMEQMKSLMKANFKRQKTIRWEDKPDSNDDE